ncbi:MAG: hypothetical protein ACRDV3_10250 [Acidothermaceae bacterium]
MTDDDFGDLDEPTDEPVERVEASLEPDADDGVDLDAADSGVDGVFDDAELAGRSAVIVPTGWQPPESTAVPAVDEAVATLTELDSLPTAEHVAYYELAHRQLQDALADLDGA